MSPPAAPRPGPVAGVLQAVRPEATAPEAVPQGATGPAAARGRGVDPEEAAAIAPQAATGSREAGGRAVSVVQGVARPPAAATGPRRAAAEEEAAEEEAAEEEAAGEEEAAAGEEEVGRRLPWPLLYSAGGVGN